MKKVVILKSRLSYLGGLEKYAKAIALAFAKKGHQVTLLTTGEPMDIEGVEVISLGKHPKSTIKSILFFKREVAKWLNKHPQDIVFGLDRNPYQTHYRAGNGLHDTYLKQKKPSLRTSIQKRFCLKNKYLLQSEKKLFENPALKRLFTNSRMVKEELYHRYSIEKDKIEVVHNGIDFDQFTLDRSLQTEAKKALCLEGIERCFLFVGHNYKRKGLEQVLKAFSLTPEKNFKLLVLGRDKNSEKYFQIAKKLKIDSKVLFLGHQKNPLLYYRASDILILPTRYDPFANVTLEALALGLYVITSKNNGGSEVLTEQSGVVIDNLEDSFQLSQAIQKTFSIPLDFHQKLEIKKTVSHLDLNAQLDKIVDLTIESS